MNKRKCKVLQGIAALVMSAMFLSEAEAFDSPAYFDKNCSSCHSVGGGDDVGPDLKGVVDRRPTDWLVKFIQSSQSLISSGDEAANDLFNKFKKRKMPDQDLKVEEVMALLDYIKAGGPAQVSQDSLPASKASIEDILKGKNIFEGRIALEKGGASCISCHSVDGLAALGGGVLGPSLTQAYSKYEDKGLSKSLAKPGFKVMKEHYADHALTESEVFSLKAFLYDVDKRGSVGEDQQNKFMFLGIGGVLIILGITDFSWRRRRRKHMKPWLSRKDQGGTL